MKTDQAEGEKSLTPKVGDTIKLISTVAGLYGRKVMYIRSKRYRIATNFCSFIEF